MPGGRQGSEEVTSNDSSWKRVWGTNTYLTQDENRTSSKVWVGGEQESENPSLDSGLSPPPLGLPPAWALEHPNPVMCLPLVALPEAAAAAAPGAKSQRESSLGATELSLHQAEGSPR